MSGFSPTPTAQQTTFQPQAQSVAQTSVTPTTTLAAETGNNTSGASSFQTLSNGDIAPGNVSKVATHSLLYSGSTTTVYAHFMPWFGGTNHMNVGYDSTDPAQVKAQVTDMISRSISGVIIDWYGPNGTRENTTALAMMQEAQSRNGAFQFAIMEDAGAISNCANTAGCDLTGALISDLNYITQTYISSPAYIRWNGNPVIFYFGVEGYPIDWTRVRANTASNLQFVFQNDGGFTRTYSNAGFSWVQPSDATSTDPMSLNYLGDFYSTAQAYPSKLPVGASYKGFDDTLASWTANRHIQQQCGQTWLDTFNKANSMWSTANQLAWFQLVTWNDYEEGTEIETGIDNCLSINASVLGNALSWNISGNENTIDHYTVFISSDGQNLMSLGDFATGSRTVDLSSFSFSSGTYSVFVKAVGKPSIVNHMSAAATYTNSAAGPVVVLDVMPSAGVAPVTVSASTARSTDATGTIASSSIDFGDGTVVSGSTANHNYVTAGTYTIKATLTDSAGLTGSQSAQVSVTQAQPPVAQLSISPATGTAPVAVTASTSASTDPQGSALSSTIDFGDGTTAPGPTVTHTYVNAGSYTVKATVTNALQLQSQATATATVNAPVSLNVSQPVNNATVAAPIHVVASGTAPSGVDALQIYLDLNLVYQVNASSFDTTVAASPGAHLVVVKLWDKLGNAYAQSVNVTVATPLATSLAVTPESITTGGTVSATVTATSGTMATSQINWGDGNSSAGPTASHVYSQAGSFTVTSIATDNAGSTSQSTAAVTVTAPTATLTVSQPANNSTVAGSIHVVASGSAPSGVDALQIYLDHNLVYQVNANSFDTVVAANPGTHLVVVKLWDKLGNAYSQSINVTVAAPLTASMAVSAATIDVGNSVTATLSATSGTMASSTINWGDGTTSTGPSATHIYQTPGAYTVIGSATDATGASSQAKATINVLAKLSSSLSLSASTIAVGNNVAATLSATSGSIASSAINWGDGTTSTGPSAAHVYQIAGSYTVTGSATDATGAVSQAAVTINVLAQFTASLSLSAPTITSSASVTATISANSGSIASSSIDWGDSSSSSGPSASHSYGSPGSYTVTATASDPTGVTTKPTATVTVVAPLATSLGLDASTIATGQSLTATVAATSGTIVSSSINWGDGSGSNGPSASHTYQSPGSYTVTATASDVTGAVVHSTAAITVVSPLAIALVLNASTVSAGQSVTAILTATSGTLTSSSIDWGDGSTSAGPSASHTYASAGIYTITGTASDAPGTAVRPTTSVNVLPPLATSLTLNQATIGAGNSVTATLTASSGTISSSAIQWGDGSSSNGPTATHVYQSPGSYSITATAFDTAGAVAQASAALTVVSPLITSLVLNAATIEAGNGVTATISATSGTVTTSSIDWGDSSSSVGPTAAHTYPSPGTYTITATVSDATGAVAHSTATLTVVAPLAASFTLNTSTIDAGQSVTATLTATSGSIASSSIDWGDGNSSNGPSASHTYTSPGIYTVTATVSDVAGASVQPKAAVSVLVPLVTSLALNASTIAAGSSVTATVSANSGTIAASTSTINWGDGSSSVGASASHMYAAAGAYTIAATSSDAAGGTAQSQANIVVDPVATVVLQTPAAGDSVSQSLRVTGYAASPIGIAGMRIYIDSSLIYQNSLGTVDVYVKPPVGSHQVTLQTQDSAGFTYQTSVTVNVSNNALNTLKGS